MFHKSFVVTYVLDTDLTCYITLNVCCRKVMYFYTMQQKSQHNNLCIHIHDMQQKN